MGPRAGDDQSRRHRRPVAGRRRLDRHPRNGRPLRRNRHADPRSARSCSRTARSSTATRDDERRTVRGCPGRTRRARHRHRRRRSRCDPAFTLRAVEGPGTPRRRRGRTRRAIRTVDHFEFYWFPHTDRVLTKTQHPTARRYATLEPVGQVRELRRRRAVVQHALRGRQPRRRRQRRPRSRRSTSSRSRALLGTRVHRPQLPRVRVAAPGEVPRDGIRGTGRAPSPDVLREIDTWLDRSGLQGRVPRRGPVRCRRRRVAVHRERPRQRIHRRAPVPPPRSPASTSTPWRRSPARSTDGRTGARCTRRTADDLRPTYATLRRLPRSAGQVRPDASVRQRVPPPGSRLTRGSNRPDPVGASLL